MSKEQCRWWERMKVWTLSLLAKSWGLFESLFRRHLANLWQVAFSCATMLATGRKCCRCPSWPLKAWPLIALSIISVSRPSVSAWLRVPHGSARRRRGDSAPPLHQPKMYRNTSTTSRREMVHCRCFILHTFQDSDLLFLSEFLGHSNTLFWIVHWLVLFGDWCSSGSLKY